MKKLIFSPLAILALFQCIVVIALSSPSLAQEWQFRKPRGTLNVVDLWHTSTALMLNLSSTVVRG
jgi:hypothetical protein